MDVVVALSSGVHTGSPTAPGFARSLAYLQIDLIDPEFRASPLANAHGTRRRLGALVRETVSAGELVAGTPIRELARTIETTVGGSLMTWACYQEGSASRWLRRDLDAVLRPSLASPRPARRTPR